MGIVGVMGHGGQNAAGGLGGQKWAAGPKNGLAGPLCGPSLASRGTVGWSFDTCRLGPQARFKHPTGWIWPAGFEFDTPAPSQPLATLRDVDLNSLASMDGW